MSDGNTGRQPGSAARGAQHRAERTTGSRGRSLAVALCLTCATGLILAIAGVIGPERDVAHAAHILRRATLAPTAWQPAAGLAGAPIALDLPLTAEDAAPLAAFDGRPVRPAAERGGGAAELDPKTLKKIAKYEKSIAKKTASIEVKQTKIGEYQTALAQALLDVTAAQGLPSSTLEEVKAKEKALKKALNAVTKWQKKITKATNKIADYNESIAALIAAIELLDPGHFQDGGDGDDPPDGGNGDDGGNTASGGVVNVPLLLQETLPVLQSGLARTGEVATFGIPFSNGDQVGLVNGRPALGVLNAETWQFRTLEKWPDGYVKWALVDVAADVAADGVNSALEIVNGVGRSSPDDLAFDTGSLIHINTGPLVAQISKLNFNLFHQVWVDGFEIVPAGQSLGIVGTAPDGTLIVPKPGTVTVAIEENGPARAVVRADGTLHTLSGLDMLDFTCRIIARAGSSNLQVDFTVRNANIARPQHVVVDGLGLAVKVKTGADPVAKVAKHDGTYTAPLTTGALVYLHQAWSAAPITGSMTVMEGQQGYEVVHNGTSIQALNGSASLYPPHGFADITGANGGVTLAYRQMPYYSPASLELLGSGDVLAGLFSTRHAEGKLWSFSWRQHESRTVTFSFHHGPGGNPAEVAKAVDIPVVGRAADYLQYDRSGALPYRLVTLAEENAAFAAMGINYSVSKHNEGLTVVRYQYTGEGGGGNNHDSVERRIGSEWLRQGFGGQYLSALNYALYKAEWQILRSDNFHDVNDPGAQNPELPHKSGYAGDYEHRYMDGVILAYHLTGDERIRDGLFDEAEILSDLINYPQDRGMYMSIRALAVVGEFTGDPVLRTELKQRLQYFCPKTVNIETTITNGWGWETATPDTGLRRYYATNVGEYDPKPPDDHYLVRGFVNGSHGPLALYHGARFLGLQDADGAMARGRMRDLAFFTREELYPYVANPVNRWLAYSYGLNTKTYYVMESTDFHPLMLGLGEAFLDTGDTEYMHRAVEQFQAFAVHDDSPYANNLYTIETRLDVQHFLRIYLDWLADGGH